MLRVSGFLISTAAMFIAEQLVIFTVPLMVYKTNGSISDSGLSFFLEWLPALLAFPIAGLFCDRIGARRHFLICNLIRLGSCAGFFALVTAFPDFALAMVIGLGAIMTFLLGQTRVSIDVLTYSQVDEAHLPRLQTAYQFVMVSSLLLGPALAAIAARYMELSDILALSGGGIALSTLIGYFTIRSEPAKDAREGSGRFGLVLIEDLRSALQEVLRQRVLLSFMLTNACLNLTMGIALITGPAMVTGVYGLAPSMYGYVGGTSGAVGLLSLLCVNRLASRFGLPAVGRAGLILSCAGALSLGVVESFWLYIAGFALMSTGICFYNIYTRSERIKYIRHGELGKVIAIFSATSLITLPLAGLAVSAAGRALASQPILIVGGLGLAMTLTLTHALIKGEAANKLQPEEAA